MAAIDKALKKLEKQAEKATKKASKPKAEKPDMGDFRETKQRWKRNAGVGGFERYPTLRGVKMADLEKGVKEYVKRAERRDDQIETAAAKQLPKAQDIVDMLRSLADMGKVRQPKYRQHVFSPAELKKLEREAKAREKESAEDDED